MISIIIPIYNRPQEAADILASLARQTDNRFEVVVVEDGSTRDCREVVDSFGDRLRLTYLQKENGGPALARNFGAEHCEGEFLVFLDSDCIVPPGYMAVVCGAVADGVEFFGGADMASDDFSPMQRAVSYSMTSFFTTGGIRGGKRKLDKFIPRSFNMGVSRRLFNAVAGFGDMRFGEDIDFSMRIIAAGAQPILLDGAEVCHKRRTNLGSFFRQVFHSGMARVNLTKRHPGSLKAVHLLPTAFLVGSLACIAAAPFWIWTLVPLVVIILTWFVDSSLRNRSLWVGCLSVATSFVQLYGYGWGFLVGLWRRGVMGQTEQKVNKTNFS